MDIFKQDRKKNLKSPLVYPNIALSGNRAVKYSLSKSSSMVTKGREVTIPSLSYKDKMSEKKITNLVMFANRLFGQDKYRIDEGTEFVVDIAKIFAAQFNAKKLYARLKYPSHIDTRYDWRNLGLEWGADSKPHRDYCREQEEIIEKYRKLHADDDRELSMGNYLSQTLPDETKNYLKYSQMEDYPLPNISNDGICYVISEAIELLYEYRTFEAPYYYILEKIGVVDLQAFTHDDEGRKRFADTIISGVMKHTMLGADHDAVKAEILVIEEVIRNVISVISWGQRHYWQSKYKHYKYNFNYRNNTRVRTNVTKHKRMVREIYNILTLKSYSGRTSRERAGKVLPMLPTEQFAQVQDILEQGISLPDGLSNETKEEIKKEGNKQARFEYQPDYGDTGGRHGKAYVRPFTPNSNVHKAIRELSKRNSDMGVVPRHMHRMTTDRKVFSNKKVVAGGSLMIDCSGSMYWSEEDLRELIEILPAARIAGYEGYNKIIDDCDGIIRVFAENGKLDTKQIELAGEYGCNSVDLEALKYLAKQPEPRIWVSDQAVVGVDDNGRAYSLNSELKVEILTFMIKHNIIPIRSNALVLKVAKELATSVKRSR